MEITCLLTKVLVKLRCIVFSSTTLHYGSASALAIQGRYEEFLLVFLC